MKSKDPVPDKAVILLLKKYEEARLRNPRWSLRAFANKVGISSGSLSEIFQGKRVLSSQLKRKISVHLQLSPSEEVDFFEEELPDRLKTHRLEYMKLTNDHFHMISDWWHYAILNLVNTHGFKPSVSWIAHRLGLEESTVEEAWERLFRLGQLKKENKKVVRAYARLETSDNVINLSVQKSHLQDLELKEKSLLNFSPDVRDHTSMTLTLNNNSIPKAKELIRIFQDRFSEEIESTPGEEVYKLSIALFPLTQSLSNPKKRGSRD